MPLTPFQEEVFKVISSHRNPDSYIAGATVIHRDPESARYSQDIDIFHDTREALVSSARLDAEALRQSGYDIEFTLEEPTFHRALVKRADKTVKLEWAADTAFRFFPIVRDEVLGYRLHDGDVSINKVLAAAGREKVRDFIDLIYLDKKCISLGLAIWAAAGKDEGYTPELLVDQLRRHSRINPVSMGNVVFAKPTDAVVLKQEWLECLQSAEALIATLPTNSLGCLYLDKAAQLARGSVYDPAWTPHFGSVKGAWPKIDEIS